MKIYSSIFMIFIAFSKICNIKKTLTAMRKTSKINLFKIFLLMKSIKLTEFLSLNNIYRYFNNNLITAFIGKYIILYSREINKL